MSDYYEQRAHHRAPMYRYQLIGFRMLAIIVGLAVVWRVIEIALAV
jgi:hypothetical protein